MSARSITQLHFSVVARVPSLLSCRSAPLQAQTTTMLRTWLLQATLLTTRQVQRSHLSMALIGPPTSKQSRSSSSCSREQAAFSFVQSAQFPCLREHIQMWLQMWLRAHTDVAARAQSSSALLIFGHNPPNQLTKTYSSNYITKK